MKLAFLLSLSLLLIACKNNNDDTLKETRSNNVEVKTANAEQEDSLIDYLKKLDRENSVGIHDTLFLKGQIQKADSLIWITASKYRAHRIIGYELPDVNSKRLIMISGWTNDVQNNPYNLKYGAHYTSDHKDSIYLKLDSFKGEFARVKILSKGKPIDVVYLEKRFLEFESEY